MPFREPALSLRDILDERKLPIIGEAAVRLGEDADRLCPGLPWHNIRGIGNWLRHRSRVDVETVWNTVMDDLPTLRTAVQSALTPPPPKS